MFLTEFNKSAIFRHVLCGLYLDSFTIFIKKSLLFKFVRVHHQSLLTASKLVREEIFSDRNYN